MLDIGGLSMDKPMRTLVALGMVAALALPLLVPHGYWLGLAWLAGLGTAALLGRPWHVRKISLTLNRRDWMLMAVLMLQVLVPLGMALYHQTPWPVSWLLLPPVLAVLGFVALSTWPPRVAWLWVGPAVAGLGLGVWALGQKLSGVDRAEGFAPLHAILFGNFSLLTGMLCLAGVGWAWGRSRHFVCVAMLAMGAFGGILASVFSGSRGGWVALPLILLVFYRSFLRWMPRCGRWVCLSGVVVLLAGCYLLPQTGVQARIDLAVSGVQHYLAGEQEGSRSVSLRLEMWRGALELVTSRPWLGHGEAGYMAGMEAQVAADKLDHGVLQHRHAHSDMLDAWAKRGLPGLGALLLLYVLPLWLFGGGLKHPDIANRALATAGLLLPISFIDFGLTYGFMSYSVGTAIYCSWLTLIWSCYRCASSEIIREQVSGRHERYGEAPRAISYKRQ